MLTLFILFLNMAIYKNTTELSKVYKGVTELSAVYFGVDLIFPITTDYLADFLVVGSGGGGGARRASGGGAGGLRTSYGATSGGGSASQTELTFSPDIVYSITIGAAGAGAAIGSDTYGTTGNNSTLSGSNISTITSLGGGAGASLVSVTRNTSGSNSINGGSGAGAGCQYYTDPGAGTSNEGYSGGNGCIGGGGGLGGGGGGGGAGGVGSAPSSCPAYSSLAAGGVGLNVEIKGSAFTYAGGGRAPNQLGAQANPTQPANTGNGGEGGGEDAVNNGGGGAGGSGVVILRIPTAKYSGTTTGSPTVTTDGTDTILTYTGSGTYTA